MNEGKENIFDLIDKFGGYDGPFKSDWLNRKVDSATTSDISATGYWAKDSQGLNRITSARLGEVVYFRLSTTGIPEGSAIRLRLYDSNSPFGKSNMNHAVYGNVSKSGVLIIKLDIELAWSKFIKADTGYEIELFWIFEFGNKLVELNSILNTSEDKYLTGIIEGEISYSCNCGWIDKTHAFTDSQRNRIDIGAKNLWKQIVDETGLQSQWSSGFQVKYTQDAQVGPTVIGVTNLYFVKNGLSLKLKEKIALSIFQEVSMEFEQLQALGVFIGRGDSSFEPADLVSDLLGFYKAVRANLTKDVILTKCKELDPNNSRTIYDGHPGTFTLSKYKNRKFTPIYFENDYCKNPAFPNEFQDIKPYPKDDDVFRDWIDLLDVYKGVPPITNPE